MPHCWKLFKVRLDMALSSWSSGQCPCPKQMAWTKWSLNVSWKSNNSTILWYCYGNQDWQNIGRIFSTGISDFAQIDFRVQLGLTERRWEPSTARAVSLSTRFSLTGSEHSKQSKILDPSNRLHQQGKVMDQVRSPSRESSQEQTRQGQRQGWRQGYKTGPKSA